MIGELVAAGCRYVHIDAPGFTAYVDEPSLAAMRARGEDPTDEFGALDHRRSRRGRWF